MLHSLPLLTRSDDEENLQLEGNGKKGWSTLRYCEIEWIKGCKDLVRAPASPHA